MLVRIIRFQSLQGLFLICFLDRHESNAFELQTVYSDFFERIENSNKFFGYHFKPDPIEMSFSGC